LEGSRTADTCAPRRSIPSGMAPQPEVPTIVPFGMFRSRVWSVRNGITSKGVTRPIGGGKMPGGRPSPGIDCCDSGPFVENECRWRAQGPGKLLDSRVCPFRLIESRKTFVGNDPSRGLIPLWQFLFADFLFDGLSTAWHRRAEFEEDSSWLQASRQRFTTG
jgi:hypothetical protein